MPRKLKEDIKLIKDMGPLYKAYDKRYGTQSYQKILIEGRARDSPDLVYENQGRLNKHVVVTSRTHELLTRYTNELGYSSINELITELNNLNLKIKHIFWSGSIDIDSQSQLLFEKILAYSKLKAKSERNGPNREIKIRVTSEMERALYFHKKNLGFRSMDETIVYLMLSTSIFMKKIS